MGTEIIQSQDVITPIFHFSGQKPCGMLFALHESQGPKSSGPPAPSLTSAFPSPGYLLGFNYTGLSFLRTSG